jgi:hypothetical protein
MQEQNDHEEVAPTPYKDFFVGSVVPVVSELILKGLPSWDAEDYYYMVEAARNPVNPLLQFAYREMSTVRNFAANEKAEAGVDEMIESLAAEIDPGYENLTDRSELKFWLALELQRLLVLAYFMLESVEDKAEGEKLEGPLRAVDTGNGPVQLFQGEVEMIHYVAEPDWTVSRN